MAGGDIAMILNISELEKEQIDSYITHMNITDPTIIRLIYEFAKLYQFWDVKGGHKQDLYSEKEIEIMKKIVAADPDRFIYSIFSDSSSTKIKEAMQTFKKQNNLKIYRIGHTNYIKKHSIGDGDMLQYEYWDKSLPVLFIRKEVNHD